MIGTGYGLKVLHKKSTVASVVTRGSETLFSVGRQNRTGTVATGSNTQLDFILTHLLRRPKFLS